MYPQISIVSLLKYLTVHTSSAGTQIVVAQTDLQKSFSVEGFYTNNGLYHIFAGLKHYKKLVLPLVFDA